MYTKLIERIAATKTTVDPRAPAHLKMPGLPLVKRDSPYYRLALEHICHTQPVKSFLEIGVKSGGSLERVLASGASIEKVTLCDFWTVNEKKRREKEAVEKIIKGYELKNFNCNFVDGSSLKSLEGLTGKYDLIGIDGSHRRDIFRHDMRQSWRLLSSNGFIVIDDLVLHTDFKIYEEVLLFLADNSEASLDFLNIAEWPGVAVITRNTTSEGMLKATIASVLRARTPKQEFFEKADKVFSGAQEVSEFLKYYIKVQDWEVVDLFIEYLCDRPLFQEATPLIEIIERQSLEIDNLSICKMIKQSAEKKHLNRIKSLKDLDIVANVFWMPEDNSAEEIHRIIEGTINELEKAH